MRRQKQQQLHEYVQYRLGSYLPLDKEGITLTRQEQEVLERFKGLLKQRLSVRKLFLFGSRARGEGDIDSDMDVLVVVDDKDIVLARNCASECAWEASFGSGIILSPVVYTREGWEEGPESASLLAKAVAQEGIPL